MKSGSFSFVNIMVLVISITIALALAEWIAGRLLLPQGYFLAQKFDKEFDIRSRLEVIAECRKNNSSCYPAVPPNTFLKTELKVNDEIVLPLSSVADSVTVGCNESGYYNIYTTDEYGFRNPEGVWKNADSIDLAFVGDSYTQGDCVNNGDHFVDFFRSQYSKVINLGAGGNGPLFELAVIKEYLESRKVRFLFWVYFERNDLTDLQRDKESSLLMQYLQPGFSQSLLSRHQEIDVALRKHIEHRLKQKEEGLPKIFPNIRLFIWQLRHKQSINSDLGVVKAQEEGKQFDLELFGKILSEAKSTIEKNGGKFVFVYLPQYERFNEEVPNPRWSAAPIKNKVLNSVVRLGIEVIDIEAKFLEHETPIELFPFALSGHYNEEGYALVASAIKEYLDKATQP